MIEDEFYATLKLNSGEEIYAKVAASEEEGRTMLILHSPITIVEVKQKRSLKMMKPNPVCLNFKENNTKNCSCQTDFLRRDVQNHKIFFCKLLCF